MFRKFAVAADPVPEDPHIAGLVQSGVFDPSLYKVIFLAGGPGSGKSKVATTLPFHKLGMRLVDQDAMLQMLAAKSSLPLRMENYTPEQVELKDKIRERAYQLTLNRDDEKNKSVIKLCLIGKLGMVIDGTGRDFDFVKGKRQFLTSLGYESFMLLVNTSLPVAQERNRLRERSLPSEMVDRFWKSVQANKPRFQALFASGQGSGGAANYHEIDNSEDAGTDVSQRAFAEATRVVQGWAARPVRAPAAVQWIKEELAKRGDTHKKLLVDVDDSEHVPVQPFNGPTGPGMGHNNPPPGQLF